MTEGAGFDPAFFDALARIEPVSFWFRARSRLVVWALAAHFPDARSFFELGCGDGFLLAAVGAARPGLRLGGGDVFAEALDGARTRVPGAELVQVDARSLPYDAEWDAVGAFDVLEHVAEDERVLAELRRAVVPGGGVLLLVPQHRWLWGGMDEWARHVRRYDRRDLLRKVRGAGLEVVRATSFVSLPLPLMALSRLRSRLAPSRYDPAAELVPRPRVNALLERVLDGERRLIERGVSFPAGGSLLVVARRVRGPVRKPPQPRLAAQARRRTPASLLHRRPA